VVAQSQQDPSLMLDEDGICFVPFEKTKFSVENKKALGLLLLLLERKSLLVRELKKMNDFIEKQQQYNDEFKQKYAWIAIMLQATN